MITQKELREMQERCNLAAPGPWTGDEEFGDVTNEHTGIAECCMANDTLFIAAARTDMPLLIAEVKRLIEEAERLREGLICQCCCNPNEPVEVICAKCLDETMRDLP